MATLTKGTQSITVPDDTVKDYVGQGWQDSSSPAPTTKTKKRPARARTPKKPKEATDAVPSRADGDTPPPAADPEPS
jgi:hypothetical protein